ncbi:MAG: diacylglycerol kinase family lipid kinase [Firmicutes bacterium]|nr:diacylglycerol kinase family lipid kinase [Bacillota bacterium]
MAVLFIVNPAAGGGRGLAAWRRVEQVLEARGLDYECRFTERRGSATELAARARDAGYSRVIGVGGDGTIQEVVNGLVDRAGHCPVPLGIVPGGTGNDFRKSLGYPSDPEGALEVALRGVERSLDLGRANGRYFLNVAGVGFDAEVAGYLNRKPKRLPGFLTYLYGILVMLVRYRPAEMTIDSGDRVIRRKCLLVSVANGPVHAGGVRICPDARPDDALFDICVAGDVGRLETLILLPQTFSGRHTRHPKIEIYRARKVRIDSEAPLVVQGDGEVFGRVPVEFEVVPGALRVAAGPIGSREGPRVQG